MVIGGFKGYSPTGSGSINPLAPDGKVKFTILDGDVNGTVADIRDNAHHVVYIDGAVHPDFATIPFRMSRVIVRYGFAYPGPSTLVGAAFGAGISCQDAVLELDQVTVSNCLAEGSGGGIYVEAGSLRTRACVIKNNSAVGSGGGIMIKHDHSHTTNVEDAFHSSQIHNTQMISNSSGTSNSFFGTYGGGGIAFVGFFPRYQAGGVSHPGISMANCLIESNRSSIGGGGFFQLYVAPGQSDYTQVQCELVSNTIVDNETFPVSHAQSTKGGGLFFFAPVFNVSKSLRISNSVVQFNRGFGGADNNLDMASYFASPLQPAMLSHNNIGPQPASSNNPVWTNFASNVIDVDPLFINSAMGNYRLSSNSPCIDVGNDFLLPADYRDLDGNGSTLSEQLPMDLDRYYGGNAPLNVRPREHNSPSANGTPGITGVDAGNSAGSITDLGCYEWKPFNPYGSI
ncbi:MAG: hypothetical protein JKY61_05220 [Planctomycetes bacterium]|nr:hypothetical protein [Planctomycetota bacterium]